MFFQVTWVASKILILEVFLVLFGRKIGVDVHDSLLLRLRIVFFESVVQPASKGKKDVVGRHRFHKVLSLISMQRRLENLTTDLDLVFLMPRMVHNKVQFPRGWNMRCPTWYCWTKILHHSRWWISNKVEFKMEIPGNTNEHQQHNLSSGKSPNM